MLTGCDSYGSDDAETNSEVAEVIISPDSVAIAAGEQADFSAVALTAGGDTVRDVRWRWESTDPSVFTVEDDGTITGHAPGTAYCGVGVADGAAGKAALVPIGLDSASVTVFLQ